MMMMMMISGRKAGGLWERWCPARVKGIEGSLRQQQQHQQHQLVVVVSRQKRCRVDAPPPPLSSSSSSPSLLAMMGGGGREERFPFDSGGGGGRGGRRMAGSDVEGMDFGWGAMATAVGRCCWASTFDNDRRHHRHHNQLLWRWCW